MRRGIFIGAAGALIAVVASIPAAAATIGSNLMAAPNGSVCEFESFEPETRVCTVGQHKLLPGHIAAGGLVAPFDGVIVRWSVVSGAAQPGTGAVKLALRAMSGPGYMEKGPEVELPSSPPSSRHVFAERMSVSAGQPIGVKISVSNRSTQAAGAPIAFREDGVGIVDIWAGEPWTPVIKSDEEGVELLLDAEIEPDADRDGYGDLTQDCFPERAGGQELCGRDFVPPVIQSRILRRQAFLRRGVILAQVTSSEAGLATLEGWLELKGRGGWAYSLRRVRKEVAPGQQIALRLKVRRRALKAARSAVRDGKKIVATLNLRVRDATHNAQAATVRVRPR